uniref:Putative C3a receptor n=1 Tax=Phallusia mammillata TaxID=59560 RepID=A0A6F9DAW2_9ASCI|nr:putative C3a receptor [Phallusia mammillata]
MSPIFISEIQVIDEYATTDLQELNALFEDATGKSNFVFYRFTFSFYYLHYYFNIFLLATMSVERCVAVWKSLRCQRYQFNRKFIIAISVVMALAALACALPSFLDQQLIVNDLNSNTTEPTNNDYQEKERNFEFYQRCFKPLEYAIEHNHSFVMDHGDISVEQCVDVLTNDSINHLEDPELGFTDDADLFSENGMPQNFTLDGSVDVDELFGFGDYEEAYTDYPVRIMEDIEYPPGSNIQVQVAERSLYHQLLNFALSAFPVEHDLKAMCDPALSEEARIYQIIVHLVIGFFIPFTAIVVSYVSIAYMIGKRARERLEPEVGEDGHVGRRMSDFLKQFVTGGGSFRTDGDRTPPYNCGSSPLLRRSLRQKRKKLDESTNLAASDLNSEAKFVPDEQASPSRAYLATNTNQSASTVKTRMDGESGVIAASEPYTPVQPSETKPPTLRAAAKVVNMRRTSGGSASSAESFQTDQTSIHTSPSPGVRLSAPTFMNQDKTLVKRACSAESSTSTATSTQGNSHARWSNDVFRSNSLDEELKKQQTDANNQQQDTGLESPTDGHDNDSTSSKRSSGTPTRVHKYSVSDSTQDVWQGSHTRLYTQKSENTKPRPFNRQISTTSNYYRSRAYSAQSRGSSGNGTIRKTIVHKNAERHMRVSRTVLTYVLVFAICWLPQRIVHTLFITENLVGKSGYFCHALTASTRILTFFSVLLNPIVYAISQREIRHYLRQKLAGVFKCGALQRRKHSQKITEQNGEQTNGLVGNENRDFSRVAEHNLTSDDISRRERHIRNRELWSRMVNRLGRKSMRTSLTASTMHGGEEKKSDGTIDEEKEEEKGQSSKDQSSSNSFKLVWEDWQQLMDIAGKKHGSNPPINDTIL